VESGNRSFTTKVTDEANIPDSKSPSTWFEWSSAIAYHAGGENTRKWLQKEGFMGSYSPISEIR
jgi:hypothetical protein